MPVYNSEMFLRQSIESVLNQTLRDIELICVDDGSTDGSLKILNEYAMNDSRVKVVSQENQTAGAARNNGISCATGKYVHYLDADDWLEPGAYELLWSKVEKQDVDFCQFQFSTYDSSLNVFQKTSHKIIETDQITTFRKNEKFFIYNAVVPWNKIIKKDVIVKNNLKFDEIICANDRSFYFKLLLVSNQIMIVPNNLIYYRTCNRSSLIGKISSKNFDCRMKPFEITFKKLNDFSDKTKKIFLDATILDLLTFFKLSDDEDRLKNYVLMLDFFKRDFMKILGDLRQYSWFDDYQKIVKHEYLLFDAQYSNKNYIERFREVSAEGELKTIKNSFSYKLGRLLTAPLKFVIRGRKK